MLVREWDCLFFLVRRVEGSDPHPKQEKITANPVLYWSVLLRKIRCTLYLKFSFKDHLLESTFSILCVYLRDIAF